MGQTKSNYWYLAFHFVLQDRFHTTSEVGLLARSSFFKVVGSPVGSTIPLNILIFIFLCLIILSVVLCFTQHRFLLWDQGIYFIHSTIFINNTLCLQLCAFVLWLILSIIYSYSYQIKSAPLVDTLVTIEW